MSCTVAHMYDDSQGLSAVEGSFTLVRATSLVNTWPKAFYKPILLEASSILVVGMWIWEAL